MSGREHTQYNEADFNKYFPRFQYTYDDFELMPSPSASSKFVLSVLKFLGILKFSRSTQNSLGIPQ